MPLASRNFKRKQALEHELKDLYCEISPGVDQATASAIWNLTADITLTHATPGAGPNGDTVTLEVEAPAANPTDTVLVDVTGTADAIVITVTPNDGTNNAATPVPLTTAELAEFLDTGAVVGKTITLTDAGSLLANIAAASGGGATDLANAGEGDGEVATFSGGVDNVDASFVSNKGHGFASVTRGTAGLFTLRLQNPYYSIRNCKAILKWSTAADINFQISAEDANDSASPEIVLLALSAGTPTDPDSAARIIFKAELKNSSVED